MKIGKFEKTQFIGFSPFLFFFKEKSSKYVSHMNGHMTCQLSLLLENKHNQSWLI